MGIAQAPGNEFNLFVMRGDRGYGKTHLLQAIGNFAQNNQENVKVKYTPAKKLASELAKAVSKGKENQLEAFYDKNDIILLDDFHEVKMDSKEQKIVEKIFNNFLNNNKQIVIASEKPIDSIMKLNNALSEQIKNGLNIQMKSPEPEIQKELFKKQLSSESAKLFDDLVNKSLIKNEKDLDMVKKEIAKLLASKNGNNK